MNGKGHFVISIVKSLIRIAVCWTTVFNSTFNIPVWATIFLVGFSCS